MPAISWRDNLGNGNMSPIAEIDADDRQAYDAPVAAIQHQLRPATRQEQCEYIPDPRPDQCFPHDLHTECIWLNIKLFLFIIQVCYALRGNSVPATDTPFVGMGHNEVGSWNEEDASLAFYGKTVDVDRTWFLRFEILPQSINPLHNVLQFGERQRVDRVCS
jgi:hypothetical protein